MEGFDGILEMKNTVQTYDWGSLTAIAELCGMTAPSPLPQAELWMGAHPKAPSQVYVHGRWTPLDRLVEAFPATILGERAARQCHDRFPYLFKILAVDAPLSVQAHPDARQAAEGFARENAAGIPLDAPNRNYRDPSEKPEIICALTGFWGLNGFRPEQGIHEKLALYCPRLRSLLPASATAAGREANHRMRDLYRFVMTLPADLQKQVTADALAHLNGADPVLEGWIRRLHDAYPGDIGILSPLLLNLVHLQPGEAMFLPAGRLHAYLEGMGIELMANSDNVLRGGLTPKHVDVSELMRVLRFAPTAVTKLTCRTRCDQMCRYETPAAGFQLSVIRSAQGQAYQSPANQAPRILLATSGRATVSWADGNRRLTLTPGASALVPAAVTQYRLSGDAVLYEAGFSED